jgi:hypothetical protein
MFKHIHLRLSEKLGFTGHGNLEHRVLNSEMALKCDLMGGREGSLGGGWALGR